ncbi:hypothetical protein LBMAG46_04390 [Planctomycetia bacterium]|nr:hypothetical protein LBMAG46_04390 [Planctomycetia bacterium]
MPVKPGHFCRQAMLKNSPCQIAVTDRNLRQYLFGNRGITIEQIQYSGKLSIAGTSFRPLPRFDLRFAQLFGLPRNPQASDRNQHEQDKQPGLSRAAAKTMPGSLIASVRLNFGRFNHATTLSGTKTNVFGKLSTRSRQLTLYHDAKTLVQGPEHSGNDEFCTYVFK